MKRTYHWSLAVNTDFLSIEELGEILCSSGITRFLERSSKCLAKRTVDVAKRAWAVEISAALACIVLIVCRWEPAMNEDRIQKDEVHKNIGGVDGELFLLKFLIDVGNILVLEVEKG